MQRFMFIHVMSSMYFTCLAVMIVESETWKCLLSHWKVREICHLPPVATLILIFIFVKLTFEPLGFLQAWYFFVCVNKFLYAFCADCQSDIEEMLNGQPSSDQLATWCAVLQKELRTKKAECKQVTKDSGVWRLWDLSFFLAGYPLLLYFL